MAAELVEGIAAAKLVDSTTTGDCSRLCERDFDEVNDDDLADFNEPTMIVGSTIISM